MLCDLALRFHKDLSHPSRGQASLGTMRGHGSNEKGVTSARQPSSLAEQKPPKYLEHLAGVSRGVASSPRLCCDTACLQRDPPRPSDLSVMCCHWCFLDWLGHPCEGVPILSNKLLVGTSQGLLNLRNGNRRRRDAFHCRNRSCGKTSCVMASGVRSPALRHPDPEEESAGQFLRCSQVCQDCPGAS